MAAARVFLSAEVIRIGLVVTALLCGGPPAFPQTKDSSDPEIATAISNLGSTKFQERQVAFRTLVRSGESAIDAIEEAAKSDNLEVATRCVEAIARIGRDKDFLPAAIAALNRLAADSSNPAANLAKDHVTKLKMTDEDRAVAALTAAGVRIYRSPDGDVFSVRINHDRQIVWLKHFKHLHSVHLTGMEVTDAGITRLVESVRLSNLTIRRSAVTDASLAKLRNLAGLKSIIISADEFTANGLRALRHIPALERLSLSSGVDADDLDTLIQIDQIDSLHLSDLRLTRQRIDRLNQLRHLKRLHFSVTAIDDETLSWLGQIAVPTSLDVSRSPQITDDGWGHLRQSRLLGLVINRCAITNAGLAHIGEIKLLDSLMIRDAPITDVGLASLHGLQTLTVLQLSDVDVTDEGVARLRGALPNLRYVSIKKRGAAAQPARMVFPRIRFQRDSVNDWNNAFIGDRVTAADIRQLKQARELGTVFLTRGTTKDEDLALLGEVPMRGVVINSEHVTDKGIESLADHPTLESVGLWSSSITDKSLESIARIPCLARLTIQKAKVTDDGVATLIARLAEVGEIKSLNFFMCPEITDQGLMGVGQLKSLEQLLLNNNDGLTSGIFIEISQLPNLKRLEVDDVTLDESDLAYLATLSKLETLGLSRGDASGALTNRGLKHLSNLKSLKSLTIQNAQIDDGGVIELVKLSAIQSLGLSGTQISDRGLAELTGGLPNLSRLGLSRTHVTDSAMEHVGKLTRLEWLWLDDTHVGDDGLRQLDGLTKLEHIYVNHKEVTSEGHLRFRRMHPATRIWLK